MIRLILGLGNPGKNYQNTRHNAGAWFVEQLAEDHHTALCPKTALHAQYSRLSLTDSLNIHIAIPTTFMNNSGDAVGAIAHYYKIKPQEVLIVHDELDFLPGVVRLKQGGGSGGHNGLKDIVRVLGSYDFWRLRIGIGHPRDKLKVPQYVLDVPQAFECMQIRKAIKDALSILLDLCIGETERAMQVLHSE